MLILSTKEYSPWAYNGLDCLVTREVFDRLEGELSRDPVCRATYEQSLEKLAPAMEMSLRGIRVNRRELVELIGGIVDEIEKLQGKFETLCVGVFGKKVSTRSPKQCATLIYDWLEVPQYRRSRSCDKAHLERAKQYFAAMPFVNMILAIRDREEQLKQLNSELDERGRRTFNLTVAGPSTGRWACRKSCFWVGYNTQNVDERLKRPFVADPGRVLVQIDLEQADSRNVGAVCYSLFGESPYLDACEAGDLHTTVCQMAWPEVDFGDNPREVADEPYYRTYSRRDCAKRIGHGTNYGGSAAAIQAATQVPQYLIKDFQRRYFEAFPDVAEWIKWTRGALRRQGCITTIFGRKRYFLGRTWEAEQLKEALAFQGQSMTAHETDAGLMRIWREVPEAELLIPVHDSILLQVPSPDLVPDLCDKMTWRSEFPDGRQFSVPVEAAWGKNWQDPAKCRVSNPDGLRKYAK